jgi:RNA polymerase sigma factor (sigma-70 family)
MLKIYTNLRTFQKRYNLFLMTLSPSPKHNVDDREVVRRSESRKEDSELIRQALARDQEAFRRLMDKYHPAIYHLISRMISDKTEVHDITQETFVKAFASLESFNHVYAFSTWLYKIASNTCIDHLRKKKLQTFSIDQTMDSDGGDYSYELPDTTYGADKEVITDQRSQLVSRAIDALPEKYRNVITLRHIEEKNYDEIAEILDLPLGTVKAHIFRGRELLYKYLRKKIRDY